MRRNRSIVLVFQSMPVCLVFCLCGPQLFGADAQGIAGRSPTVAGFELRPTLENRQQKAQGAPLGNWRSGAFSSSGVQHGSDTTFHWRHGAFLGVQTTLSYSTIHYGRSIHRSRWGHGFSIGYEQVLFPPGNEPFVRYAIPFQATIFRGRIHCWEMGLGVLFTNAFDARDFSSAFEAGQSSERFLVAETLWATWQPIGYRYDRPKGRLTFRVCPELAMNILELNGDWVDFTAFGSDGYSNQWDLVPRLSFMIGWLFS
jgi:hypothetical protein